MKRNKIILIVVLLLIIIVGFSYLIFSSFNSHDNLNITNNTTNNSIINSSLDVNDSLNVSDNDNLDDDSSYSETTSDSYSIYNSYSSSSGYSSSKSESDDDSNDEFTASDAQKAAKEKVGEVGGYDISKLKVGKPKYKDSYDGWLVPFYHKKTGKFVGSSYVSPDWAYGGFDDYDDYKKIISGKEPKKSKSNPPISKNG